MSSSDDSSDASVDDRDVSLRGIAAQVPKLTLVKRLTNIQRQFEFDCEKSINFVEHLECLRFHHSAKRSRNGQPSGPIALMKRHIIDGSKGNFVAVSWTWSPSPGFETKKPDDGYHVEERGSTRLVPSGVRDSILTRIRKYMEYKKTDHFWIDKQCIVQTPGREKEIGMQAMDLVYGRSKYPIALLARPIASQEELDLLTRICKGDLINSGAGLSTLSEMAPRETALVAMHLLKNITDDLWWTRGWTYQENFRAFFRMVLLLPHAPALSCEKDAKLFGHLSGQLCIQSKMFHEQATRFCVAFNKQYHDPLEQELYDSVMARAGSYRALFQEEVARGEIPSPQVMSPIIIKNVTQRGLERVWDRIPIIANCCQYKALLDSMELDKAKDSVSLTTLALYLMNGEILMNEPEHPDNVDNTRDSTVVEFIQAQSYKWLRFPSPGNGSLTFNKGCRFADPVRLSKDGILTKGHLWAVEKLVSAEHFKTRRRPSRRTSRLDYVTFKLRHIADKLEELGEYGLARLLNTELAGKRETFSQDWKSWMSESLVEAVNGGRALQVGIARLVGPRNPGEDSGALFVIEDNVFTRDGDSDEDNDEDNDEDSGEENESEESEESDALAFEELEEDDQILIFTSFRERESNWAAELNDLDRYVSMAVRCDDVRENRPKLYTTKRWVWGLCFFQGQPRNEVVFPWPEALVSL